LAVATAANGQRVRMMSEAVEGGTGQQVVAKDLGPLFESAIAVGYLEYERSELFPNNAHYVDFDRLKEGEFHIMVMMIEARS
jgi:ethanolamine utilization protein EutQ (cupin superfamily)